jgi:hypothetical protein
VNKNLAYPKVGNDVARAASLEASIDFLCETYFSCDTEHESCFRDNSTLLPKRVVDISNNDRYCLVECPISTVGTYAALSYSWGERGFAMATSNNYEELKHGFDSAILPTAFQDAAAMTRSLNIQYLWIDTLCIIQDSRSDWEEQAAMMGEVFESAAITIAASSSLNPYHSLFEMRDCMYEEIELMNETRGGLFDVAFKARRKINRGIHAKTGRSTHKDPLETRAWGLQERMLSRRLIAFTGAELQWTCRTLRSCECHQRTYPAQPPFAKCNGAPSAEILAKNSKIWSRIIEEYSSRELRFPSDRLPALSGLARKFGATNSLTYNAGGWNETLLYDLVWQRDVESARVSDSWISPSYSWASAPGAVNFDTLGIRILALDFYTQKSWYHITKLLAVTYMARLRMAHYPFEATRWRLNYGGLLLKMLKGTPSLSEIQNTRQTRIRGPYVNFLSTQLYYPTAKRQLR